MSLRAKPILPVVALLLLIPVTMLIGLNLALQIPGVQTCLHSAISSVIGIPFSTGGIYVTPLGNLRIQGVICSTEGQPPLFTANAAIIHPDFPSLLRGEISIKGVTLNHPVFRPSLARSSMLIPPLPSTQTAPIPQPKIVDLTVPQEKITEHQSSPTFPKNSSFPATTRNIANKFRHLTISDAEFTLLDTNNRPIASLHGIAFHGRRDANGGWNGIVQASEATVGKGLILHDLYSPVTLSSQRTTLSLNDFAAVFGGGKLSGTFALNLSPILPKYNASLNLSGASLNQFLTDASLENSSAEGRISGNIQLSGIAGSGMTMEGQGDLLCTDATIEPVNFLKQIGQILQIDELQLLRLSEGKTHFTIHDGGVAVDALTLRSENLILSAQGPVRFNGDLDLQARLLFNEKLTSRMKGILGPQLSPAVEPGYSQVVFHVSGPLKNPKTDLLERLTGIRIGGDLGGLLQGLFGHRAPSPQSSQMPAATH